MSTPSPNRSVSDEREAAAARLIARLSRSGKLSEAARARLAAVVAPPYKVATRQPMVRDGAATPDPCLLVAGHAIAFKQAGDGARQILAIHLPGDIVGLGWLGLDSADHGVAAVGDAAVAVLPREAAAAAIADHPDIAQALWRETLKEAAILRQWLIGIGRRDAYARVAHLLCEMALRSAASGIGGADRFAFPLTQSDIADATAITAVHVNRTLQRLRGDRLVAIGGGEVCIDDWQGLATAAGFDGSYLGLPPRDAG